jgi:hypothetical protein
MITIRCCSYRTRKTCFYIWKRISRRIVDRKTIALIPRWLRRIKDGVEENVLLWGIPGKTGSVIF